MKKKISQRLLEIIDALPLKEGMRVLEIGCGPGVSAREILDRFNDIYVLAIDRSPNAIEQARSSSQKELNSGKLKLLQCSIEDFVLPKEEEKFDIAFAIRVGALDGRHPESEKTSLKRIKNCLKKGGKLYIDGGLPLKEIPLSHR